MGSLPDDPTRTALIPSTPTPMHIFSSAARYLAGKALAILTTIFVVVFLTVLIMSYPGGGRTGERFSPFESNLEVQIHSLIQLSIYNNVIPRDAGGNPIQMEVDALERRLRVEAGLDLPFLPRYLLWTLKALMFD